MTFIDVLKSVGGVKPCDRCNQDNFECQKYIFCHKCKQKLTIDLAPLLARPDMVEFVSSQLLDECEINKCEYKGGVDKITNKYIRPIVVVGPQRAHSLVYEVARQLGGTAVVAEPNHTFQIKKEWRDKYPQGTLFETINPQAFEIAVTSYRLSYPIPPDATVLFVTDRVDGAELDSVIGTAVSSVVGLRAKGGNVLPYVLALITDRPEVVVVPGDSSVASSLRVISLHQEI